MESVYSPSSSSSSSSSDQYRNWLELPRDLTASILLRLGAIEILENAQNVCTLWRNICKDPSMWRYIDMRNLGDLHDMPYDLEKMCLHAIDRSSGQLVGINIEYFGTDELLTHITQRYVFLYIFFSFPSVLMREMKPLIHNVCMNANAFDTDDDRRYLCLILFELLLFGFGVI
jgi:hypothetical protein